jgi:hypothetical protein
MLWLPSVNPEWVLPLEQETHALPFIEHVAAAPASPVKPRVTEED